MKLRLLLFCVYMACTSMSASAQPRQMQRPDDPTGYKDTYKVTEGQMLDDMDLEKERGITIKSHAIQMEYTRNGEKYILNLIDTPGHVDFSYEVSRSIAACEGALLIVDATQGVQAQTISNLYMAIDHNLEIIPVINKIDMPSAMPDEVEDEIVELIGCDPEDIIRASGKTGEGVEQILNAVVDRIPHPEGSKDAPLPQTIEQKQEFLRTRHIALWDVAAECSIRGSADSSISAVTANDIAPLLRSTQTKAVFLNGQTAQKLFRKYLSEETAKTPPNAGKCMRRISKRAALPLFL